jgi:hypothetical protein
MTPHLHLASEELSIGPKHILIGQPPPITTLWDETSLKLVQLCQGMHLGMQPNFFTVFAQLKPRMLLRQSGN